MRHGAVRRLGVAFLLAVVAAALWAGKVAAQGAPRLDVAGRWYIQGEHDTRGAYQGTITYTLRRDGFLGATKDVVFATGESDHWSGFASLQGQRLTQVLTRQVGTGLTHGLGDAFGNQAGDLPVVEEVAVVGVGPAADRMAGYFYSPQDSLHGGTENLVRRPWADDRAEILVDGAEAFPAIREALASATHHIHLETYIFHDDETGREIARLLAERARAGVEVRVLLDRLGSGEAQDLMETVRAAGGQVIFEGAYVSGVGNWLWERVRGVGRGLGSLLGLVSGPEAPRERRQIHNRDHRKIIIVDGRIGFCGGMNIGEEYERDWHDVHSRLQGPIVRALQQHFLERWRSWGGSLDGMDWTAIYPPETAESPAFYSDGSEDIQSYAITTLPGVSTEIRAEYLRWIGAAQTEIWIENAYFLDDEIIDALRAAIRRGVRVVVIVPNDEENDVAAARNAYGFIRNDLVRSGIELYEYPDRMAHAKVAMIDSVWSTIGSANLDDASLGMLAEMNVALLDRPFAESMMAQIFAPDVPRSARVEVHEDGFWSRLRNGFFGLFRGWL